MAEEEKEEEEEQREIEEENGGGRDGEGEKGLGQEEKSKGLGSYLVNGIKREGKSRSGTPGKRKAEDDGGSARKR